MLNIYMRYWRRKEQAGIKSEEEWWTRGCGVLFEYNDRMEYISRKEVQYPIRRTVVCFG